MIKSKDNFSKFSKLNFFITGGTGSFGKKFIQILQKKIKPKRIVVYSRDELKQYDMQNQYAASNMRFFLGDVRDEARLNQALRNIDIVIHAAALKQVPAAEYNPTEVIKTNIFGAENVIKASIKNNVKKVISLSTDKAASPINLYGATKLVSDKLFTSANNIVGDKGPVFSVVRYGNVLGSRGSVLPLFKEKLINKDKFLPITHLDTTRFFLTLENSVNFVLKSLQRMQGGEIFIPKCASFKITDLAKSLKKDISFKVVGLRPGEKLHEVLCPKDDSSHTIEFSSFFLIKPIINFGKKKNYFKLPTKEIGKYVDKGFEYDSFNNKNKIDIKKIKKIIAK